MINKLTIANKEKTGSPTQGLKKSSEDLFRHFTNEWQSEAQTH